MAKLHEDEAERLCATDHDVGRRAFISVTSVSLLGVAVGCSTDTAGTDGGGDGGTPDAIFPDAPGSDTAINPDGTPGDVLMWATVPALALTLGVPVDVDLGMYLTDPSGMAAITLDMTLPDGLTLEAGVIHGTPTMVTASADYVATADDGL